MNIIKNAFTFTLSQYNDGLIVPCLQQCLIQLNIADDEALEIVIAISEAVTNSFVHGYLGNEIGLVDVCLRVLFNKFLYVKVTDKGCGIVDVATAVQAFVTRNPVGVGLGFTIIDNFMHKYKVRSKCGKGTRVMMSRVLVECE